MFALIYLSLAWLGVQAETGNLSPTFGFAASVTWPAAPLYLALLLGLVLGPIWLQHIILREKQLLKLDPLARNLDRIVKSPSLHHDHVLDRLANYRLAFDTVAASFPDWPIHPRQRNFIVATTTVVSVPALSAVSRVLT